MTLEELPADVMTLRELPADALSDDQCLPARFRMAGHYPHAIPLADHAFRWAAKENSKDLMEYVLENGAPLNITALLRSAEVICNAEALALLKAKRASSGDETGKRLAYKAEKVDGHKRSRWRSWFKPKP